MHSALPFEHFRLPDGRKTLLSVSLCPSSKHWLVYLPGSAAELQSALDPDLQELLGPEHERANILVINKAGLTERGPNRVFERSFSREQRIADVLCVLKSRIPRGHSLCLIGYSEGAYIAPEVALKDCRVKALVLLAGGTRSWVDEELNMSDDRSFARVFRRVLEIYAGRAPRKYWRGIPHRAWLSFDTDATLKALERLQVPVLTLHGSADELVDLDSVSEDVQKLRRLKPGLIHSKVLRGYDHTFNHRWEQVYRASKPFLHRRFLKVDLRR